MKTKMNYIVRRRSDDMYLNKNHNFQKTMDARTYFTLDEVSKIKKEIGKEAFEEDYLFYIVMNQE